MVQMVNAPGMVKNQWMRRGSGLYTKPNPTFSKQGLQLYAPLWHPEQQGFLLSYDGNDYLSNATANFRSGDSAGAIEVWFRTTSTARQMLFASSDEALDANNISFEIGTNVAGTLVVVSADASARNLRTTTTYNDGRWHHAVLSSDGTAYSIIVDGISEALTIVSGTNNGNWFADIANRDNIMIGARKNTTYNNYLTGEIGFTRIYSREMLQLEARTNYRRGRKATASDTTGLVFNLPTTEGTGNPVDTVGSLTMTLTGATWVEGLMDRSTNALALTSFGSPGWGNQGRTFGGANYIAVDPVITQLASNTKGTVTGWFKVTDITNSQSIIWFGDTDANAYVGALRQVGGKPSIFVRTVAAIQWSLTTTNVVFANNTWHFFALVQDAVSPWCMIDGVVPTQTVTETTDKTKWFAGIAGVDNARIGGRFDQSVSTNYLTGSIGEIFIYNQALIAGQLQQIYLATKWRYGL